MNSMRKVLCFLMAMMLAAFALPSVGAPQYAKQYYLTMASYPLTPTTVVAQLSNVTVSSGNSNISSFQLTVTGAKITGFAPLSKGTATITNSGSTIFYSGISPIKPGATSNFSITLGDCGDDITWTVNGVWTGSMGDAFGFFLDGLPAPNMSPSVSCGVLACGGSDTVTDSSNPGSVSVQRGSYNKDGGVVANTCATVPYYYTDFTYTKHFAWPLTGPSSDPAAAFLYTISSAPLTRVSWLPTSGTPVFVTGLSCLAPPVAGGFAILPAPYGALAAADTGGSTILVDTTGALVAHPTVNVDFDVVIGTDRLTVNYNHGPANNETWKVVARHVGGTTGALQGIGKKVMYQPLPILPPLDPGTGLTWLGPYVAGMQAQMCIVEQGGTFTRIIDIGDGWVGLP